MNLKDAGSIEEYREKKVTDLIEYLKKFDREFYSYDYQLETNHAFVFLLNNDEIVLLPSNCSLEENGLLINNKSIFYKMIENDYFPIQSIETNYFEIYKNELKTFNLDIDKYVKKMEIEMDIIILEREIFDDNFFIEFNKKIKKINLLKTRENYILPLTAVLTKIILKNNKGVLNLNKKYGLYNPFYLPTVKIDKKRMDLIIIENIISGLNNPKSFDLKFCYQLLTK